MPEVNPTLPRLGRPPWPVLLSLVGGALLMHLGVIDSLSPSAATRDVPPLQALSEPSRVSAVQIRTLPPDGAQTPEASRAPEAVATAATPPTAVMSQTLEAVGATATALDPAATPKVFAPARPLNRVRDAPEFADTRMALTPSDPPTVSVSLSSTQPPALALSAAPVNTPVGPTRAEDAPEPTVLAAAPVAAPGAVPTRVSASSGWAGDEADAPTYRTVLPAPFTLNYRFGRGLMTGSGELSWRLVDGRYDLRLSGRLAGLTLLNQVSSGAVDPAGLAPLRFTDKRLRGSVQAANFQRSADGRSGKITFSGPSVSYPLRPGVQDRLSWMVQLPAIVQAEPQRLAEGQRISIPVVGARGDADIWVFRFRGWELVQTPAGAVRAARFSREPLGRYDTQIEVWLDPALHHLPVRARLTQAPDGDTLELLRL